jgi:hypothetical protein
MGTKLQQAFIFIILLSISKPGIVVKKLFSSEVKANTSVTGSQNNPNIQILSNNNFVITWQNLQTGNLEFQLYDPWGTPLGGNLIGYPIDKPYRRYIHSLSGGGFVVIYNHLGNLQGQIYHNDGTINGGLFGINTDTGNLYESIDISELSDGNFVVLWNTSINNFYYKVFTSTGSLVTPGSVLVVDSTTNKIAASVKAGASGTFIICWRKKGLVSDNILCRFFDTIGPLPSSSTITVDSFITLAGRDLGLMSIDVLSNGDFVIVYELLVILNYDTYFAIVGADQSVHLGRTLAALPNLTNKRNPSVATLTTGEYIVTYDQTGIFYQIFQSNNLPVGGVLTLIQALFDITHIHTNAMVAAYFRDGGYIIVFQSQNQFSPTSGEDIYFNIWYPDETSVTCQNISTAIIKAQGTMSLDLSSSVWDDFPGTMKIVFSILPSDGSITLSGSAVTANTPYPYNASFSYQTGLLNSVISYYAEDYFGNQSPICTISISVCYESCETCIVSGTVADHKCTSCKTGFFQLGSNCYSTCPTPNYYNDTTTYTCASCTSPCGDCSGPTECITCDNGYNLVENLTTNNCVPSCPSAHYQSGNLCKACDPLCTACSISPINCSSCVASASLSKGNECILNTDTNTAVPNTNSPDNSINPDNPDTTLPEDGSVPAAIDNPIYFPSIDSAPICHLSTCQNAGTCEIKFISIECKCPPDYIGSLCQFDANNFNYNDYIGI